MSHVITTSTEEWSAPYVLCLTCSRAFKPSAGGPLAATGHSLSERNGRTIAVFITKEHCTCVHATPPPSTHAS